MVIVGGCFTYLPPLFQFGGFVLATSNKIAKAEETLQAHDVEIKRTSSSIREFRSVWCMDLLSKKNVNQTVVSTCTRWINEP